MKYGLVYFCHADGTVDCITQVEGYAQGCPLSAVFASLVLGELLLSLNEDLKDRCQHCTNKHGDKGFTETVAFFDDNNIVILLEEVFWYLSEFISRGAKYGCTMNIDKTKILTGITGSSILGLPLPQQAKDSLRKSLALLKIGEVSTGIKIVGAPIGSTEFANQRFT